MSEVLVSQLSPSSPEFRENAAHHRALAARLSGELAKAREGGGEKERARHVARGKLPVRERLERLLDPGTAFLEVAPLAGWGLYEDAAPGAGLVTGVGRVSGREVVVVANDATVKGGTYYPVTVKKHLRAQEIAMENALPAVYLVDSGGAFLPLQAEVFPDRDHFGRIFYNQARMSAAGLPQIAAVLGSCTAGGAYVPAMSDETVIVKNQGTIFLAGPPLVKAATGEDVTAEELGGGDVHTRLSGVADHLAEDDADALEKVRDIVAHLGGAPCEAPGASRPRSPGIPRTSSTASSRETSAGRTTCASCSRGSSTDRASTNSSRGTGPRSYGLRPRLGLPRGRPREQRRSLLRVGAQGDALHRDGVPARGAPRLLPEHHGLHGRKGVRTGRHREGRREDGPCGRERRRSEVHASRGRLFRRGKLRDVRARYQPRFLWTWPNARISVMGGEQAADVLATVKDDQRLREGMAKMTEAERNAFRKPTLEKYEVEGNPYFATGRLWDDGILDPVETRRVLALGLAAAANGPRRETRFGVFRM